jgi:8-oxo-dGTP pyrophosphatase MutT (NUDIX family)
MAAPDLRRSYGAIALIECPYGPDSRSWLARWNRHWESYFFVAGHKHDNESSRDCIVRELGEELGIAEGRNFLVPARPITRLEFDAWSRSVQVETHYVMDIFPVQILGDATWQVLRADSRVRCVTEAEIRAQRGEDGAPVSPTMVRVIESLPPAWRGAAGGRGGGSPWPRE